MTVIGLLQRVSRAVVVVERTPVAAIGSGLLVFVGVRPDDTEHSSTKLLERVLKYRIFEDDSGKMNLSLQQIRGGLLLVPQFTLAADTMHGLRPGFSTAAPPEHGRRLFEYLVNAARERHSPVESGRFGATMQVSLVNEGPATFWLAS
jgi:D-tyrosyl-tRNA(Tyr) deacylase